MTEQETLAYEAAFPVANMIRSAASHQERAQLLLKLSDAGLIGHHVDIDRACAQSGFAAGQSFLVWRVAALCRTRDAHGLLPDVLARELDAWRQVLSLVAAGTTPLPTDGEARHGG